MSIELKILGSNSAAFAHNRHHTAQFLRVQNTYFLIDCGEGTQLLLKKNNIKFSKINNIVISHLHGDHCYSLIGLLSTLHLYGRKTTLKLFGPPGLAETITQQLRNSTTTLNYDIDFTEWTPGKTEEIYEDKYITVTTFPLDHRIPCSGFLFREKKKRRRINKNVVKQELTPLQINALKDGKDAIDMHGELIYKWEEATYPAQPSHSYAFCSDTKYIPTLHELLKDVYMMYHEATFSEDMSERAELTYHSTARQAAQVAKDANAGKLILGHFSTRFKDLTPLLEEAKTVFENTELAIEGTMFTTK
ncbi:MAG: ribonuclease Z [Cyclobacteriaceae bacterium]